MAIIRATGLIIRKDWYGLALLNPELRTASILPSWHHVLCSTCVGEYERHCGAFESASKREAVGDITVLCADQIILDHGQAYCCVCGAKSFVEAVYEAAPGDGAYECTGMHELIEE